MNKPHRLLRPGVRHPALVWGLALLGLTIAVIAGWQAWEQAERTSVARQALLTLQAMHRTAAPIKPDKGAVELQRRWNALAAERNFNWYPIFRMLEQTSSTDIELLEFLPDKVERRIVLRGEARTNEALINYLSTLSAQGTLDDVYLSHQKTATRAGMTVIAFEVRASISKREMNVQ